MPVSLMQENLIQKRCAAALGDVARTRYLHELNELYEKMPQDEDTHVLVHAKLAALDRQFPAAESILLEHVTKINEALLTALRV